MSVGSSTDGELDGNGLTNVAQQIFDGEVKHAFQTSGVLRGTTTVRNDVTGDIYKFRKMGKGLANQKTSSADVTPMNVTHDLISCTLNNWNAPEYTDIFDAKEVNFDEKTELQQVIAGALGRRYDQLIIDAMKGQTENEVSGGLSLASLIASSEALNDSGVPSGGRHIALTAAGLSLLLAKTEVQSSDFNNVKALVSGELNTFMGFTFHVIETRTEGGLAAGTAIAWHDSAVGVAVGMEVSAKVDWVPQKTSWLCNGLMKAGAVARDAKGIVNIAAA